jgi:3-oxoacyl-[acyl-carrier-protein] synthase-3
VNPARVRVGIAGSGSYVPERVVPNSFFEGLVDTSDEWIVQRTGIRERRWAAEGECTSDLATRAAERALADAGIAGRDIDLVVLGTVSPDRFIPPSAPQIAERLGAVNAGVFDCNAACTGFMAAFSTGEAFVAAGRARNVLVIGAETLSRYTDLTDRSSCILFGDAAGAMVLSPFETCGQGEVLKTTLGGDGAGYQHIYMPAGGSHRPTSHETVEAREHYIRVNGREVYRFAVNKMVDMCREMLGEHDLSELGVVVPHQVNARIIQAAIERLGWPEEKVMVNIERYGNSSSGTVPLAFDEARRAGRFEKQKLVILTAFGAGLTWGGALVRW